MKVGNWVSIPPVVQNSLSDQTKNLLEKEQTCFFFFSEIYSQNLGKKNTASVPSPLSISATAVFPKPLRGVKSQMEYMDVAREGFLKSAGSSKMNLVLFF